jgi:hypothetical protein
MGVPKLRLEDPARGVEVALVIFLVVTDGGEGGGESSLVEDEGVFRVPVIAAPPAG